jgi:molecular chaperone GrpE
MSKNIKDKKKVQKTAHDKTSEEHKKEVKKRVSWKEKYEMLQEENEKLKDKYLRTVAEFENFRRRSLEEKSSWIKNATQRLVLEICNVLDNFERALHSDMKEVNGKSFQEGVKMIYQQLEDVLKKEGVQKIDALEKDFDPNFHEALAHIPSELEENKVAAIIQNGYLMNDKVIRPARVAVSNGIKPQKEEKNEIAEQSEKNEKKKNR